MRIQSPSWTHKLANSSILTEALAHKFGSLVSPKHDEQKKKNYDLEKTWKKKKKILEIY